MCSPFLPLLLCALFAAFATGSASRAPETEGVFGVKDPSGRVDLPSLRGRVLLVVNVASECGYTEEGYRSMAALAKKYDQHGLTVLAVPSNEFGEQEPGGNDEIQAFADTYFEEGDLILMDKTKTNGPDAHPLFKMLRAQSGAGDVSWNFERWVVGRDGFVAAHSVSADPWSNTEHAIRRELLEPEPGHDDL